MKNRIKRFITGASVLILMLVFCISSHAFENDINVLISPNENLYTVSLYINSPQKITDIDIKLFTNSEHLQITSSSVENTDIQNLGSSFDELSDNIKPDKNYFTFFNEATANKVSFSGFFINEYSSKNCLHILNITVKANDSFSDTDTITVEYAINSENNSHTGTNSYFLKDGNKIYSTVAECYQLGDANADGKVSAIDARTILRAAVGLETIDLISLPYANADYDKKITASDARYALRTAVGLEKAVYHRYIASPDKNASCENGGEFIFSCEFTGKSFKLSAKAGHHTEENKGCYNTGKCVICNEKAFEKGEHQFDEKGLCSLCGANKNIISDTQNKLKPIAENISSYDFAASEALKIRNYEDFIAYTILATKEIKKATELTKGINGMQTVYTDFEKAYSMRFEAIMAFTDNNGKIMLSEASCRKIQLSVNNSKELIDIGNLENEQ